MSDTSPRAEVVASAPSLFDEAQLAVAGFLARYRLPPLVYGGRLLPFRHHRWVSAALAC